MVVEGVMEGNLPWALVFTGVFIAIIVEILGIPVLPFAIGLYLPIHLSTPIMAGGLIRYLLEKKKYADEKKKTECVQSGILYTFGLIAGEGIVGILLAICAVIPFRDGSFGDFINISGTINLGNIEALIFFALLLCSIVWYSRWNPQLKNRK